MKAKNLTQTALLAAAICILAPWVLPVGAVPYSLGSFAVSLAGGIGGAKKGTVATLIYILLGAVGLPVFSGFSGGAQMLLGPTGGFIIGFALLALAVGVITQKAPSFGGCILANLGGYALLYLVGTAWYCLSTDADILSAVAVCILPFVLIDFVKMIVASALTLRLRSVINKHIH